MASRRRGKGRRKVGRKKADDAARFDIVRSNATTPRSTTPTLGRRHLSLICGFRSIDESGAESVLGFDRRVEGLGRIGPEGVPRV